MPDPAEGLEQANESALDVNSDAGFNALLARQAAGGEEPSEEVKATLAALEDSDTSVAAGLTEESTPRRDEETGRFTPAAQPAAVEEGAAPAAEEREGEEDTAYADFLARFNGNHEAAAKAAVKESTEAQSLIGRQSAEVAAARKAEQESAQLRERLARLEGQAESRPQTPVPLVDEQTESWLDNNVSTQGGAATMRWVAENRPDLIEPLISIWEQYEPAQAARFATRYDSIREGGQKEEAKPDPILAQLRQREQLGGVIRAAREQMPEGDWNLIQQDVAELATDEKTPEIIRKAIFSDDTATQQQGVAAVIELAKGRVIARATSKATQEAADEQKAATTEAKKKATLGTGSLRPVEERQPQAGEEMTTEERTKLFHAALMKTETTSVSDGLTNAA